MTTLPYPRWAHRIHALANERQVNSRRDCAIEDLIDPEDYDEDISDYCSSSDESCVTDKGCVFDDCEMCIKHDYEPEYHDYSIDFTETGLYFELFQDQREERKKEIRDKKEQRKRWIEKKERLTKKDIKLESRRWKWVEAALQKMIAKEARKEKLPALGDLRKRRFTLVSPDHIKACPWDFASERFIEFCSEYLVDDISEDDSDYDPDEYDEYGRQRRQGERISGSVHMLGDTICRLEPFVPPKHARQLTTYLQSQDRKWQMHLFFADDNQLLLTVPKGLLLEKDYHMPDGAPDELVYHGMCTDYLMAKERKEEERRGAATSK